MGIGWVEEEIEGVDLEDQRLNYRLSRVLSLLSKRPNVSIPSACGGYADMKAAYRFFDNDKVTFDRILEPHLESTLSRMAEYSTVLMVQDSSEIVLDRPNEQMKGVGYLGNSRRGILLHNQHVFTPDGIPLGTVGAEIISRKSKPRKKDKKEQKKRPIESKESYRWLTGIQKAQEVSEQLPNTQCICVADSESDIYEVISESPKYAKGVDWIIRSCQNRKLMEEEDVENYLYEEVLKTPVLFTKEIDVRASNGSKISCDDRKRRQPRKARVAKMEVHATTVTLKPPHRKDRKLSPVTINVVLLLETKPPKGEVPIQWLLLTTLPVQKKSDIKKIVEYYTVRWMIEILFKTLKSGCRAQERQFEHIDRFLPCLALYLIVAWRTLYICRYSRSLPNISCEAIFDPAEWKAAYMVVRQEPPPKKNSYIITNAKNNRPAWWLCRSKE